MFVLRINTPTMHVDVTDRFVKDGGSIPPTSIILKKTTRLLGVFRMAIVRKLERIILNKNSTHTEVNTTFTIVESDGNRFYKSTLMDQGNARYKEKKPVNSVFRRGY